MGDNTEELIRSSSDSVLCGSFWDEMVWNVAHHLPFDLCLATLQVVITTHIAYAACIVLGGVLVQTTPAASLGGVGGIGTKGMGICAKGTNTLESKMESFWRVVREIERHEHVTSLPAPHVWQVCPPGQGEMRSSGLQSAPRSAFSSAFPSALRSALSPSDFSPPFYDALRGPEPQLIITLSPHVPSSLRYDEVLKFTRRACEGAFVGDGVRGVEVEIEVTSLSSHVSVPEI
ncbi:hypothetical protein F4604DRAFT_1280744 [Suillus subluteus]|nr:hypothetical protein F4604DRAFT_1280744 [Suillus subluteus]